jgi:hypothetical protein
MAIMFLLVTDVLLHGRSKWLIKLIGIHIRTTATVLYKGKVTPEQSTKTQRGRRGIDLLFL